jgi:membrane associated rhomboid family serine protease
MAASFAVVPAQLFQVHVFGGAVTVPNELLHVPEIFTLVTYQFLHGDIIHIASNMLFLWVFGDNVEDAMGHLRFLIFYIVCGVAGGCCPPRSCR